VDLHVVGCVAPGGAIVDQAVTEKTANGTLSLFKSAILNFKSMFTHPRVFFGRPSLYMVGGVYVVTYMAANTISTMCEVHKKEPFFCEYL
jgi:hypothetical protein